MSTARAVSKSSVTHSPYQRLFSLPGTKAFCISGAVARLPISMMSLGIVLALNHLYDNWTIAGTMSAAYVLAMSWVTTAGTVGTSIGSSVAGIVLDASSPHVGMMLPFLFTLASVPLALAGWVLAKRRV